MSSSSIMMVPSATMFGVPYAPVNVYTTPPAVAAPTVVPSSLPNAEVELKQVLNLLYISLYNFIQCSFYYVHIIVIILRRLQKCFQTLTKKLSNQYMTLIKAKKTLQLIHCFKCVNKPQFFTQFAICHFIVYPLLISIPLEYNVRKSNL